MKGLPILSVRGRPLRFKVKYFIKCLRLGLCYVLLFLDLLVKVGATQPWRQGSIRVRVILLLHSRHVCSVFMSV